MEMTYHCEVERAERVKNIIEKIGIGQVVKEVYKMDFEKNKAGKYICITDTGITLIKSEDKKTIITMYVTTYRELVAAYNGTKSTPTYLQKKVDRNHSHFTKNVKTIWK